MDVAYQKRLESQQALDRLKEPIEELVGNLAPLLPDEGWIGGTKPDVSGQPYLLHFWATWCGPCKNDLPLLKRVAEDGGLVIGMHPAGTAAGDVEQVIHDSGLGYPTFLERTEKSGNPIAGYPAKIFPYCILVDAKGRVAAHGGLMENNAEILARFRELRQKSDEAREPSDSNASATQEDGSVSGVLINADDGTPVVGARIILRGGRTNHTESDDAGRFRFEGIPPLKRHYRIWAYADNLVTPLVQIEHTISDDGESARFAPLQLEMTEGHRARFVVTSAESGEPVERANVRFGYPERRKVPTDADGTALVEGLLPQEYNVTVEAEGYARALPQINLTEAAATTEYRVRLDAGGIVRGIVLDEQGQPIPEVQIVYREPQTAIGFYGDEVSTADDGRFRNRFLPLNAPIEVSVSADGYLSHKQEVTILPSMRKVEVNLTLKQRPPGGSITGVVKDSQGQPVAGAEIVNTGRGSQVETTTDSDGKFELHDVGESYTGHMIYVTAKNHAPQRIEVTPGTPEAPGNVEVTFDPGHNIHGQILDENSKPLAGAYISPLSSAYEFDLANTITTGTDGRFSFDSLPEDARFYVDHKNYPGMRGMTYELDGEEPVIIQFEPPGVIWGRVVDAEAGEPVSQFRIRVGFSRDRRPGDAKGTYNGTWSDPGLSFNSQKGEFVIKPLKSGMPVALTVSADSFERTLIGRAVAAPIDASEELTVSLKPADKVEPFTLSGQFLDHVGEPAAGAQLRLIVSTNPPAGSDDNSYNWLLVKNGQLARKSYVDQFLSAITDAQGRFEFKGIAAGKFLQLAYWGTGVPQGRSLAFDRTRAGESEQITVNLPEPARVQGTIERANFPDVGSVKLSRERSAWHEYAIDLRDDQTSIAFDDLPPGQYSIYLAAKPVEYTEDGNAFFRISTIASQKIELKAGETREITFTDPDKAF